MSESPIEEDQAEPRSLPLGTRLSLYYIFVIFLVYFVLGWAVTMMLLSPEEQRRYFSGESETGIGFSLAVHALLAPLVMVATIGFVHFLDKKPLHAIGAVWPPGTPAQRAAGQLFLALLGAVSLLGTWYVVVDFRLQFEVEGVTTPGVTPSVDAVEIALLGLGFFISASIYEWMLRGYIYSTLREKFSWVHAGGISAFLFAMLQMGNPNMPAAALATAFLLGFLLSAMRELSGSVWTSALFHGAWNFVMGCILSLPVSGISMARLREVRVTGPQAWSGGDFGPEGSWSMVVLLLIAVVGMASLLSRAEEMVEDDP